MSTERPIPTPTQALAGVIAAARQRSGLTPAALAARAGLEPSTYEAIERGEHQPSLETVVQLAAGLELSVAELFERAGL